MDNKFIQDKELVKQQECPVNRVHKLDKGVKLVQYCAGQLPKNTCHPILPEVEM